MEYKVGDKVKVRTWEDMKKEFGLDCFYNIKCRCTFLEDMKEYCGKIVTIKSSRNSADDKYRIYGIKEDGGWWSWSNDMFEDISKTNKPTNKFFFKKDKTIYYDKDGKRYVVKCCEDDVYDKKVGMLYVLAKAQGIDLREIDELIEEPKKEQKKDKKTKWKVGDKFVIIDNKHFEKSIKNGERGIIVDIFNTTMLGNKGFSLNINGHEQFIGNDIDDCLEKI